MTVTHRRKSQRARGTRTHGWGLTHRGAGNRGGRGNAGSGKKADQKKSRFWGRRFGKHGFTSKNPKHMAEEIPINIRRIEEKADRWVADKKATKEGDVYIIDLKKIGYTKVLGTGKLTKKLKLNVPTATAKVIEKVKAAGGDVIVS